jgi:hypothetical protein
MSVRRACVSPARLQALAFFAPDFSTFPPLSAERKSATRRSAARSASEAGESGGFHWPCRESYDRPADRSRAMGEQRAAEEAEPKTSRLRAQKGRPSAGSEG